MKEVKKNRAEVIVYLLELKNNNLRAQSISMQEDIMVQNNALYSTLELIIACLMDKYKISDRDLRKVMEEKVREEFRKGE